MVSNPSDIDPFIAVGSELATARAAQGLSLSDISSQLRISVKYLEFLENGEREKLPGATYVLGFIRSYAKYLDLEADAMCQRLSETMAASDRQPEYHFIENKTAGGSDWRNMIMIGVVLIIVSYTAWYFMHDDYVLDAELTASTELGTELSTGLDTELSTETDIAPTQPEITVDTATIQTGSDINITEDTATKQNDAEQSELISDMADGSSTDHTAANTNPTTMPVRTDGLAITALAEAWVELSTPVGEPVLAKLLTAGEMITIPANNNYVLTTGNAGAISLGYVDQDTPWLALGVAGQILNKKPIDTLLPNN
jgi:cytoskeleton protein RodZ